MCSSGVSDTTQVLSNVTKKLRVKELLELIHVPLLEFATHTHIMCALQLTYWEVFYGLMRPRLNWLDLGLQLRHLHTTEEKINPQVYQGFLQDHVRVSTHLLKLRRSLWCSRSKSTTERLQTKERPGQSPDHNPVETLWADLRWETWKANILRICLSWCSSLKKNGPNFPLNTEQLQETFGLRFLVPNELQPVSKSKGWLTFSTTTVSVEWLRSRNAQKICCYIN